MKLSRVKFSLCGKTVLRLILSVLALTLVSQLRAQVGNNNPTGPSGIFNGNITTGCSYDPYTGNATRTITDVAVAGAVGEYPLAFTRTYNSRNGVNNNFGLSGWHHNYDWDLEDSATSRSAGSRPTSYTVDYPDGRSVTFTYSASDPYYRGPLGVRERLQPLDLTTYKVYLILPDGGKVEVAAEQYSTGPDGSEIFWYHYVATAIIDPYGQRTAFTYDQNSRLTKVTEPAGRYLQLFYTTTTGPMIDHVTASDGRIVQYHYINSAFSPGTTVYAVLDQVTYYGSSTWIAHYKYRDPNVGSVSGIPLLLTADDPMYPGPMHMIAYTYQSTNNPDGTTRVYGQIRSENYFDGTNVGASVSTLSVGTSTDSNVRTETRGDGPTRTFHYSTTGYLASCTDFRSVLASQTYDSNKYVNSVTDRNGNITTFTRDPITGFATQITYPYTHGDTPGQTIQPTVTYTYKNNYYLSSVKDEGGHLTTLTLDTTTNRVNRIDYPDGGYETFVYNSFGQVTSHRLTTTGTETFTYDTSGLKQTYRNPSNASTSPTARYQYDAYDRISGVTDALGTSSGDLNHTTSFFYNLRGQLTKTTHPIDPVDAARHSITNTYNPDGTLDHQSDEMGHTTSFTYDDYRRVTSVTPPLRLTGDTLHTTSSYYDASGTGDDYTHTDSNVTHVVLPSGKKITTDYDEDYRKLSVVATAADGVTDRAATTYAYDKVGNLTKLTDPRSHSTTTAYDERNRPSQVTDALTNVTTLTYDTAGRKKTVTRPNGQTITYNTFDEMNRVLQQTVTQNPNSAATTKYTYTDAGLLATMQDPHLVAIGSTDTYTYAYDTTGRKTTVTYPADSRGVYRVERFTYDTAGRLFTHQNRSAEKQTFTYDALNRLTGFSWNLSNGNPDTLTPAVTFGYDIASRQTSITNANATISRVYWNDNLLRSETTTAADNVARAVSYTYDADANRATIRYPDGAYSFTYGYTGRNQLKSIVDNASGATTNYSYDVNGNLSQRNPGNVTSSTYTYDALDRVTHITHSLVGNTRTFDYGYDNVGNRNWTKREGNVGDVFDYDNNDQVTVVKLNIANPDTTAPGSQTIHYDTNGNRTSFAPYGTTDTYTTNNLNEYTVRNSISAAYNASADMTTGFDGSTYTYDAQNRLLSATESGVTETFDYDGLNRQVSRTVAGITTYNVYDGWALIEEYQSGGMTAAYLHGATGLVKDLTTNNYYYQDGSGSTSHLADSAGNLLEWYRYDLQGTPVFYNFANTQQSASAYGVRHLFTGQQWYSELGLYDLRNRFYSPDIGRFLQADPIGFNGDATNLYRYCGNNPVMFADPTGLNIQLWTTWAGGSSPFHAYWAVPNPSSGQMVYYDFGPQEGYGWLAETFGSVPGDWSSSVDISDAGATLMAEWGTTPGQDAAAYNALEQAYEQAQQGNSDDYSTLYDSCYSLPERIIADALSGEDDGEELADAFMSYFTSSVSTPIGAFGVGGQGGSFFVSSGSGLNIPGGINWNPAGCGPSVLPSGFLGGSYGPLTPSQWKWFLYPAGMQKPSYKSYLANYPQGVSLGANKGKSASAFTGARGQ